MSIHRQERESSNGYVPVLIIGAGASGIAMGYQLKKRLGFDKFQIVDRQSGIGGESHFGDTNPEQFEANIGTRRVVE
jgi:protoporphyrinogen oxidase